MTNLNFQDHIKAGYSRRARAAFFTTLQAELESPLVNTTMLRRGLRSLVELDYESVRKHAHYRLELWLAFLNKIQGSSLSSQSTDVVNRFMRGNLISISKYLINSVGSGCQEDLKAATYVLAKIREVHGEAQLIENLIRDAAAVVDNARVSGLYLFLKDLNKGDVTDAFLKAEGYDRGAFVKECLERPSSSLDFSAHFLKEGREVLYPVLKNQISNDTLSSILNLAGNKYSLKNMLSVVIVDASFFNSTQYKSLSTENKVRVLKQLMQEQQIDVTSAVSRLKGEMKDCQKMDLIKQAIDYGHAASVRHLLGSSTDTLLTDPNKADDEGRVLLHYAVSARVKNLEVLKAVLALTNKPSTQDKKGETPLMLAAMSGWVDGVKAMLAVRRVNKLKYITLKCKAGWSVLHCAARSQDVDILRALIPYFGDELKGELAAKTKKGSTPLVLGAISGRLRREVALELLSHGADRHVANNDGHSYESMSLGKEWRVEASDVSIATVSTSEFDQVKAQVMHILCNYIFAANYWFGCRDEGQSGHPAWRSALFDELQNVNSCQEQNDLTGWFTAVRSASPIAGSPLVSDSVSTEIHAAMDKAGFFAASTPAVPCVPPVTFNGGGQQSPTYAV